MQCCECYEQGVCDDTVTTVTYSGEKWQIIARSVSKMEIFDYHTNYNRNNKQCIIKLKVL